MVATVTVLNPRRALDRSRQEQERDFPTRGRGLAEDPVEDQVVNQDKAKTAYNNAREFYKGGIKSSNKEYNDAFSRQGKADQLVSAMADTWKSLELQPSSHQSRRAAQPSSAFKQGSPKDFRRQQNSTTVRNRDGECRQYGGQLRSDGMRCVTFCSKAGDSAE